MGFDFRRSFDLPGRYVRALWGGFGSIDILPNPSISTHIHATRPIFHSIRRGACGYRRTLGRSRRGATRKTNRSVTLIGIDILARPSVFVIIHAGVQYKETQSAGVKILYKLFYTYLLQRRQSINFGSSALRGNR